jgi:hypothetical protein
VGCYIPPPLTEISSRDLRMRGGGYKNDERGIDRIARRATEQLKGGKTSRLRDLIVNEARFEETRNKKVTWDYMSLLKRVRAPNFTIRRKGHVVLKLEGCLRWGFELESIFKFLMIFKVRSLIQYECMMSCNVSALYVPHQKKKGSPNIDGIRVVGGNSHSSP